MNVMDGQQLIKIDYYKWAGGLQFGFLLLQFGATGVFVGDDR